MAGRGYGCSLIILGASGILWSVDDVFLLAVAIINRILAGDDQSLSEIIERFRRRARLVDNMDGFMGIEVLVNRKKREVLVITRWRSREDLEEWLASREFARAHGSSGSLNASSHGAIYEVLEV